MTQKTFIETDENGSDNIYDNTSKDLLYNWCY